MGLGKPCPHELVEYAFEVADRVVRGDYSGKTLLDVAKETQREAGSVLPWKQRLWNATYIFRHGAPDVIQAVRDGKIALHAGMGLVKKFPFDEQPSKLQEYLAMPRDAHGKRIAPKVSDRDKPRVAADLKPSLFSFEEVKRIYLGIKDRITILGGYPRSLTKEETIELVALRNRMTSIIREKGAKKVDVATPMFAEQEAQE